EIGSNRAQCAGDKPAAGGRFTRPEAPRGKRVCLVGRGPRGEPAVSPGEASEAARRAAERACAGERTRTSRGLAAQRDLNPPRLPIPPHPRGANSIVRGQPLDLAV